MKIARIFLLSSVILVSLFVVVQVTTASTPLEANECGSSGPWGEPGGLIVKKTVHCEKDRSWKWDIFKSANFSELTLSEGQVQTVEYSVELSAVPVDSSLHVSGVIYAQNQSGESIVIHSVDDSLGDVLKCEYGGNEISLPYTLASNAIIVCVYEGSPASAVSENVALVSYGDGKSQEARAEIDWSKATTTVTDECVYVGDNHLGTLGEVCAPGGTISYSLDIGPFDACGDYQFKNGASFKTFDTQVTGSSTWTIDINVPCDIGCSLTPGYWKTHSVYGPAHYDETWAQVGEDTSFFLSGQSYYEVLWTSPQGNPYFILAHAYIAAELNQLNGADFTAASAAFGQATTLFETSTPDDVDGLKGPDKHVWTDLATILDDYNNGLIGPGHCSE